LPAPEPPDPLEPVQLLHERLREIARAQPEALALEIPAGTGRARFALTYAQLDSRAEALAREWRPLLAEALVQAAEPVVALWMGRTSPGLLVAQLACWRLGAAYLAIDPALPLDHAQYLLEDAQVEFVVCDHDCGEQVRPAAGNRKVLEFDGRLETSTDRLVAGSEALPRIPPDRLAYLIYTSGSTGRPKGVAIEHHSIANLIDEDVQLFGLGPGDRVAQGSSPSYDSSLEEVWLALASGATVVVMDEETIRAGPDWLAWLRAERITVICPPPTLLRTTGCRDAGSELPELRWVYAGGEALPEDLAGIWGGGSQGRSGPRLVNGYGPTECTVTVLRSEVRDASAVHIGRPVRGNQAWVMDAAGEVLPRGAEGELWISGVSLARGYLRRPELTTERFPVHPKLGRVYRTGDRVRETPSGELDYLGRIDHQVKLRGHRIELEAVEARLAEQPGIAQAACLLQHSGPRTQLVAWLVAESGVERPDAGALRRDLLALLPEPMVPSAIAWIDRLPTSVGGKLDRRRLPQWSEVLEPEGHSQVAELPSDPRTRSIVEAMAEVLELASLPDPEADFFEDLGGDSLAAAWLISVLRKNPATEGVAVRDLYSARSAAKLSMQLESSSVAGGGSNDGVGDARTDAGTPRDSAGASRETSASAAQRFAFTAVQAGVLAIEWSVAALVLRGLWLGVGLRVLEVVSPWTLLLLAAPALMGLAGLAAGLQLGLTLALKRWVLPRYVPGRYPAFGAFHLRHWLVTRMVRRLPWGLVRGTRLTERLLRLLGAQIGERVHIHRGVDLANGGWNLLTIGDDAAIEQDASLRLVEIDGGEWVVGPVRIGSAASVAVRASLAPDSEVGAQSRLEPLSYLSSGVRVPSGERWLGTPAQRVGFMEPATVCQPSRAGTDAGILLGGVLFAWLRSLPYIAALWWGLGGRQGPGLVASIVDPAAASRGYAQVGLWLCVGLVPDLVLLATYARWLGRRAQSGGERFALYGGIAGPWIAMWWATGLVERAGTWLSGTLFWPAWLRLAGMRVGRGSEISTIVDTVPSGVEIGAESFLADGVYLGGARVHAGWVQAGQTKLGRDTFVGNHAVIPAGANLPADVLVGVCTLAESLPSPGAWFGQPPFLLPRPQTPSFDRSLTHHPGVLRRINRLLWETARLLLPLGTAALAWILFQVAFWLPTSSAPTNSIGVNEAHADSSPGRSPNPDKSANFGLSAGFATSPNLATDEVIVTSEVLADSVSSVSRAESSSSPAQAAFLSWLGAALALWLTAASAFLAVVTLKWLLLGKVAPGRHPLWSCWCSRWDFLYVVWGRFARPVLAIFEGTLLLNALLRLFGMRIGPGVLLGRGFAQVVDPDMLHFEAGSTVAGIFQAHTFEDRVLKIDHLTIGPGATLGAGALAFYGVHLQPHARVHPGSVALKGETLTAGEDYRGVPLVAVPRPRANP